MQDLRVIEVEGKRVLTTKQIAEAYGADVKTIQYNFRYNKPRYILGKHYIELTGDELRRLKTRSEFQSSLKYAKSLYLWTEKGALLHAKSLNTDKAWEVYDYLVDFYFHAKEQLVTEKKTKLVPQKQKKADEEVINDPENMDIQKAIFEARRYVTAIDVVIESLEAYWHEQNYQDLKVCLNVLWFGLGRKILDLKVDGPKSEMKTRY